MLNTAGNKRLLPRSFTSDSRPICLFSQLLAQQLRIFLRNAGLIARKKHIVIRNRPAEITALHRRERKLKQRFRSVFTAKPHNAQICADGFLFALHLVVDPGHLDLNLLLKTELILRF